jgi:pimeloyl-ACP methyl ester carboxylesterase
MKIFQDISAVESGDDTAERQDWEQEVFEQAKEVLWSDDYLELPSKFDIHEYKIMERFCLDFPDERISDELLDKIRGGSGAFRRFKDAKRMVEFKDWRAEDIKSIQLPTLIINGDADVVRPEHAMEMFRLLPNAKLAILPECHGEYIGEITAVKEGSKLPEMTVAMIEEFLDMP